MSKFTQIPQDVLQWELSPYLSGMDRFNFNQVLRADERVYKKFAPDFVLRHQLAVLFTEYTSIALRIASANNSLGDGGLVIDKRVLRQGKAAMHDMYKFMQTGGVLLCQYLPRTKQIFTRDLERCIRGDSDIFYACSELDQVFLSFRATETLEKVNQMEFVRPITMLTKYMKSLGTA